MLWNMQSQALTIFNELLTSDLPVLNSLSVKLSQLVKLDVTNMQSNMNETSLVMFADDASCVGCYVVIFVGRQPQKTYFRSQCFVKSTVIVAVVYGYESQLQQFSVTSLIQGQNIRSCNGTFVLMILSQIVFASALTNMPFIGKSPIAFVEFPPCGTSRFGSVISQQYGPSCSVNGLTVQPTPSPTQPSSAPTMRFAEARYSMKVAYLNSGLSSCFFIMFTLPFIMLPSSPPVTLFAADLTVLFADDISESVRLSRTLFLLASSYPPYGKNFIVTSKVENGSIVFAQTPSDELNRDKKSCRVVPLLFPVVESTAESIMLPIAPIS